MENIFILVYSVTDRNSFGELEAYRDQIFCTKVEECILIILVGNKIDLKNQRQVSTEEGEALANSWRVPFVETSAKSGINADKPFYEAVCFYLRKIVDHRILVLTKLRNSLKIWQIFEKKKVEKEVQNIEKKNTCSLFF